MTSILFVCLGNICRSPTAEAVMRHLVRERGLEDRVVVESAGTGDWHVGGPPDERATAAAARRGIIVNGAAQQVTAADFGRFDLIVAMDRQNLKDLQRIAPDAAAAEKLRLLREYDAASAGAPDLDVPDPYYGGEGGFDEVLDLVDAACRGLLDDVVAAP